MLIISYLSNEHLHKKLGRRWEGNFPPHPTDATRAAGWEKISFVWGKGEASTFSNYPKFYDILLSNVYSVYPVL
jgi:hypothetical protein